MIVDIIISGPITGCVYALLAIGFSLIFGVALFILSALYALLMKARLDLAIRSTVEDRKVANLMGMNENLAAMITMGVSAGLTTFAGAVVVPRTTLSPLGWCTF